MITLDGIIEAPGTWQYGLFDIDMIENMKAQIENEDTVLLGGNTYLEWFKGWPYSKDKPYGAHINSVPKYVFSKTLDEVTWGDFDNITLIKNDFGKI